jgi:hypothetical protein
VRSSDGLQGGKGVGLGGLWVGMLVCVRVGGVVLVYSTWIFDSVVEVTREVFDLQLIKRTPKKAIMSIIQKYPLESFMSKFLLYLLLNVIVDFNLDQKHWMELWFFSILHHIDKNMLRSSIHHDN